LANPIFRAPRISMNLELSYQPSPSAIAKAAAARWLKILRTRNKNAIYGVALSGGRLAATLFDEIAAATADQKELFANVHFFWADERCVPPTDPESNFGVATEHLFEPLNIPEEQIHRIHGEIEDDYAIREAEAEICRILPMASSGQPILDLAFLGMGEDGHIASLFPNEPTTLVMDSRVYRSVLASKPPPKRITLGYQALIAAAEVWILASGAPKKEAFDAATSSIGDFPIVRLLKNRASTLFFNDIE
jgi:6-phosphogluconolactonase